MCDTGLMAAVLNRRMKDIELDTDRVGKLVETFVFTELAAQIDLSSCSPSARDRLARGESDDAFKVM